MEEYESKAEGQLKGTLRRLQLESKKKMEALQDKRSQLEAQLQQVQTDIEQQEDLRVATLMRMQNQVNPSAFIKFTAAMLSHDHFKF